MAYLTEEFYENVLKNYWEKLELPDDQNKIVVEQIRAKLRTMKGYQRIKREFPLYEFERPREECPSKLQEPEAAGTLPATKKEEEFDPNDGVCFEQEVSAPPKENEEQERPEPAEVDWRLSSESEQSEQHCQQEMERRVEMGIYGSLVRITRTKSKMITLKLADVIIKNRSGEFLLKRLSAKFDLNYTNNVRSLD